MATDSRISLLGEVTDVGGELAQGQQTGERFRTAGVREQLLDQSSQVNQQNIAQTQGAYMNQLATGLKGKSLDQRAAIVAQQLPFMAQMGFNPADILSQDLSNQGLDGVITQTLPFVAPNARTSGGFQFGATTRVQDEEGNLFSATEVRDPTTGEISIKQVPIEGDLVSNIGETPSERQAREVGTAVEKTTEAGGAQTGVLVEREEELRPGAIETQRQELDTALDAELKATDMKDIRVRRKAHIANGVVAKDSIEKIARMSEINDRVITGGATSLTKAVTDWLGTTEGNLGEFNRASGELVLSTIRQLGANPTEGERAFLEKIQPSVGQSPEVNAAILKDLMRIAERQVDRAKRLTANPSLDPNEMILNEPEFVSEAAVSTQQTPQSVTQQTTATTVDPVTGVVDAEAYVDSLFNF